MALTKILRDYFTLKWRKYIPRDFNKGLTYFWRGVNFATVDIGFDILIQIKMSKNVSEWSECVKKRSSLKSVNSDSN